MLNLLSPEIPKGTETTLRVEYGQGYQNVTCPERSEEIAEYGLVSIKGGGEFPETEMELTQFVKATCFKSVYGVSCAKLVQCN